MGGKYFGQFEVGQTIVTLGLGVLKPVFTGDTIRAGTEAVALRESQSRPTRGIVTFEHKGINQRDGLVRSRRRVAVMMRRSA